MLERAIHWAMQGHAGQFRKFAVAGHRLPYIAHSIEVMHVVWEWGAGNSVLMSAAVLHDILEESNTTEKTLAKVFGEPIARLVRELTHVPHEGDKETYLRRFAKASIGAVVIKLADRYCNLRHRLVTSPESVPGYYKKSMILIDVMRARRSEIAASLGEPVAQAIARAYEKLAVEIEQLSPNAADKENRSGTTDTP